MANHITRRKYLSTAMGITAVALAGCSDGESNGSDSDGNTTATATQTPTETEADTEMATPTSTATATATQTETQEADATIVAGPGGSLVFDPENLRISTGDTIEWRFDSAGHNVSCRPDVASQISLPDGAEPFSSHPPDDQSETDPAGSTYRHTFEVAGSYTYVCVPHANAGMVGDIIVR